MDAYQRHPAMPGGKSIFFKVPSYRQGYSIKEIKLPCGQCSGCRLEKSRQWAIRCHHEASLHESNSFITLTYSDEYLPQYKSLKKSDFQKFMKRLREQNSNTKIRYYHCGEYGENFARPHYHACLFNFDFDDKRKHKKTKDGEQLYTSETLERLWPFGFSTIGAVTFKSAAYVARYIMKKRFGTLSQYYYCDYDDITGEISNVREPEYSTMSLKPGIGADWYKKFGITDVHNLDQVIINGKKCRPPRYYDKLYEVNYPSDHVALKERRQSNAEKHADNNTPERLAVRETIQNARMNLLPRNYETGESDDP